MWDAEEQRGMFNNKSTFVVKKKKKRIQTIVLWCNFSSVITILQMRNCAIQVWHLKWKEQKKIPFRNFDHYFCEQNVHDTLTDISAWLVY